MIKGVQMLRPQVAAVTAVMCLVSLTVVASGRPEDTGGDEVTIALGRYYEAPQLTALVANGVLPPVDERLPQRPYVSATVSGTYSGTISLLLQGTEDLSDYVKHNFVAPAVDLFEDWELSDDFRRINLRLRDGTKWADGEAFTSDDLLFVYENIINNAASFGEPPPYWKGGSMKAIGDLDVEITFDEPNQHFFRAILGQGPSPSLYLPSHYVEAFHKTFNDDVETDAKAAGFDTWQDYFTSKLEAVKTPTLNPWELVEKDSTHVVMERNPYFWSIDSIRNQLPYVDRWITSTDSEQIDFLNPIIGQELVARGSLDAWESYPSGVFVSRGDKITTISPGSTYVVSGKKSLSTIFFGDQYYLLVRPKNADDSDPCATQDCWIFQGREGSNRPENMLPDGVE